MAADGNQLIGSIMIFAGNFAPRSWAFCDGQLLSINSNQALYAILGTTYGGDGRTTFGLPDLRGRLPVGPRHGSGLSNYVLGERGGQETHTLTIPEMPSHNHLTQNNPALDESVLLSGDPAVREVPIAGDVRAASNFDDKNALNGFGPPTNTNIVEGQTLSGSAGVSILNNGGQQPHNNIQPFLSINYIIALQGLFPSRN